jgi:hypothetical protein
MLVMRIVGLVTGEATPFDDQFLKEYDPSRKGKSPDGKPMVAHMVTTPNIDEAMTFADIVEGHKVWTKVDPERPVRNDGLPNRPLTAFSVVFEAKEAVVASGKEVKP